MIQQIIHLPWPPAALSPNGSQGDVFGKARAARDYKATCAALLRERGKGIARLPAGSTVSRISLTFCPPTRHRFDLDNITRRCKPMLDALASAIGVDDGDWQSMLLARGDTCKDGGVIVQIFTGPAEDAVTIPHVGRVS